MEASNDKYDISLEKNYKGRKIETKFRLSRKLSTDGETYINVIVHYFIDSNRIKFKIFEKDSIIANFNEQTLSDMQTMTGQDAIKIFIEGEIQYLKQMINNNLVEEIPRQNETL